MIYLIIPMALTAYFFVLEHRIIGLYLYLFVNIFLAIYNYYVGSYPQMILMIIYTILTIVGIWKWGDK